MCSAKANGVAKIDHNPKITRKVLSTDRPASLQKKVVFLLLFFPGTTNDNPRSQLIQTFTTHTTLNTEWQNTTIVFR